MYTSWPDITIAVTPASAPGMHCRREARRSAPALDASRQEAVERLQTQMPDARIELDDALAAPRYIYRAGGFLSGCRTATPAIAASDTNAPPAVATNQVAEASADVAAQEAPWDAGERVAQFVDANRALFGHDPWYNRPQCPIALNGSTATGAAWATAVYSRSLVYGY
jgi:hypothetical protein